MGESYSRTLVETAAATLLIPKRSGVLANNKAYRSEILPTVSSDSCQNRLSS